MARLYISCEGQTEEMFVKQILSPHLLSRGIYATPIVLHTSVLKSGKATRGGGNSYQIIRADIIKLCNDTNAFVTTMYDYYKFPSIDGKTDWVSADDLENKLSQDINRSNFHPNIIQYEFEGLLFSDLNAFSVCNMRKWAIQQLQKECNGLSPEDINGGENTAPSKRIKKQHGGYQKVLDGISIAETIGLEKIRSCCPRFNAWVSWMESLESD